MLGTRRQVVLVATAVAAGLLLLVWAASTGPGDAVRGGASAHVRAPAATATATPSATARAQGPPRHPAPHRVLDLSWLGALIETVVALLLALGLFLLCRGLLERWRARPRDHRLRAEFELLPDTDQVREELHRRRLEQLDALAAGSPRNGIVACWAGFEEAAARAGVAPTPAETSTEFVTRFLHGLDVDPRAAGGLARLYREARFSTHVLPESARDRAREALDQVHADLAAPTRTGGDG